MVMPFAGTFLSPSRVAAGAATGAGAAVGFAGDGAGGLAAVGGSVFEGVGIGGLAAGFGATPSLFGSGFFASGFLGSGFLMDGLGAGAFLGAGFAAAFADPPDLDLGAGRLAVLVFEVLDTWVRPLAALRRRETE
jgi:hypothetical protein